MLQEIEHPTIGNNDTMTITITFVAFHLGPLKLAGIPTKFSETPPSIRLPPPVLCQHTREVLKTELNYDDNTIDRLNEMGVIGLAKME